MALKWMVVDCVLITPSRSGRTHPPQVYTWGDPPALETTERRIVIGTEIGGTATSVTIAVIAVIEAMTEIATAVTIMAAPDQVMEEEEVSIVWVGRVLPPLSIGRGNYY